MLIYSTFINRKPSLPIKLLFQFGGINKFYIICLLFVVFLNLFCLSNITLTIILAFYLKSLKNPFCRQQDVRATEIDKVDMHLSFRPGDIVKALVVSFLLEIPLLHVH